MLTLTPTLIIIQGLHIALTLTLPQVKAKNKTSTLTLTFAIRDAITGANVELMRFYIFNPHTFCDYKFIDIISLTIISQSKHFP